MLLLAALLLAPAQAHDVLLLHGTSTAWVAQVEGYLLADPRITTVSSRDGSVLTPTLTQLQAYDAVLLFSDAAWAQPTALGDALSAYLDGGGGVVVASFTFGEGNQPTGAFLPLLPILPSSAIPVPDVLVPVDPSSPLMAGVTSVDVLGSSYLADAPLAAGAHLVASFTGGGAAVAEWSIDGLGTVVGVNLFPPDATQFPLSWDPSTDGATLFANALDFAALNLGTPVVRRFRAWSHGVCPGLIYLRAGHATPGARIAMLSGQPTGLTVVPAGRCAGASIPIGNASLRISGFADAAGVVTFNPIVGPGACGRTFVAFDLDNCIATAPATLP